MAITDSIITDNQLPQTRIAGGNAPLEKDAFLKLLLAQMQHQDPLEPMDNREMLSQMAQFTSLEQMTNLNKNFESFNSNSTFTQATSFLGKQIEIANPDTTPGQAPTITSKVMRISFSQDGPIFTLSNGMVANTSQVISVTQPAAG